MPAPSCRKLFVHAIRLLASRANWIAGNSRLTRIPIMAMTTKSSMSVIAPRDALFRKWLICRSFERSESIPRRQVEIAWPASILAAYRKDFCLSTCRLLVFRYKQEYSQYTSMQSAFSSARIPELQSQRFPPIAAASYVKNTTGGRCGNATSDDARRRLNMG